MNRFTACLSAAAAIAVGTTALPALATTPEAPAATAPIDKVAPATRRYCIVDTITGSRVPQKVCHTRDAWMKQGFDPLARK